MHVFVGTKLVGKDINQNLEIVSALAEVLHQISRHSVQVP